MADSGGEAKGELPRAAYARAAERGPMTSNLLNIRTYRQMRGPVRRGPEMTEISEADLRELLDKQRIQDVVLRVARAINRCDEDLLLACYHPDATEDHGRYKGDIPGLLAYLRQRPMDPAQPPIQHAMTNTLVDLDGDVAWAESYGEVRTVQPDGSVARTFSRYLDRFERRDGAWRIARRQVVLEGGRPGLTLTDFAAGSRDRTDPSYARERG